MIMHYRDKQLTIEVAVGLSQRGYVPKIKFWDDTFIVGIPCKTKDDAIKYAEEQALYLLKKLAHEGLVYLVDKERDLRVNVI